MTLHVENTDEFFLESNDNVMIFVRDWPNKNKTKKNLGIVLVHGLGEHCGRYIHISKFFNQLGFTVRSFDLRGHGQSDGKRGDIPSSESILRDMRVVINDFSQQLSEPPLVLAHSMGGLFACHFALMGLAPISGIILSSPALQIELGTFQKYLFYFSKLFFPHTGVVHGSNGIFLSHDSEVINAYQADSLVHTKISAFLLNSMLLSIKYIKKNTNNLKVPLLLLIAGDDRVVNSNGSKEFSLQLNHQLTTSSVKTIIYPNFYHEIFNELESKLVFEDVRIWLEEKNYMPAKES